MIIIWLKYMIQEVKDNKLNKLNFKHIKSDTIVICFIFKSSFNEANIMQTYEKNLECI